MHAYGLFVISVDETQTGFCVVESNVITVVMDDGRDHQVLLPFHISAGWPLERGILFQRITKQESKPGRSNLWVWCGYPIRCSLSNLSLSSLSLLPHYCILVISSPLLLPAPHSPQRDMSLYVCVLWRHCVTLSDACLSGSRCCILWLICHQSYHALAMSWVTCQIVFTTWFTPPANHLLTWLSFMTLLPRLTPCTLCAGQPPKYVVSSYGWSNRFTH